MKVLYIIDQKVESGKTSGIIHKVKGQLSQWSQNECEVGLLSMYCFKLYDADLNLKDDSKAFDIKRHGRYFTLLRMVLSTFKLFLYLKKNKYDLIYMRQRPWMPFSQKILGSNRVIVEINTFDEKEYQVISKAMYLYNRYSRKWFYPFADGFVGVTSELADHYSKEFNKEVISIGNGIHVANYQIESPENEKPVIIFVGAPGFSWHGLDKVTYLAEQLPEFDFKIIGIDGENTKNIQYHGYLPLEEVKQIASQADIGICSLSLYINGLKESSTLKSRQYLAHGLPIVYAYDDTDLVGDEPFSLKIPNTKDNTNTHLKEIKEFVLNAKGNIELRRLARDFAENKLDVGTKEKQRIDFFEKIVSELNILYIIDQEIEGGMTAGIIHKISAQLDYWCRNGANVKLLSLYNFKVYNCNLELIDDSKSFDISIHNKYMTLFRLIYSTLKLRLNIHNYKRDLIYMRVRPYVPFTRSCLKNDKVIFELNTNDIEEWKAVNKSMYLYNLLTRKLFFSLADSFIAMSKEVREMYLSFGKEVKIIENSINVDEINFVEVTGNQRAQITFVGSPGFKWNGIEKIPVMAKAMPAFDFHIVGESGENLDNLTYYGFVSLEKVNEILNKTDVAIATLSMYEKGLSAVSTIKTTRYLAQGLPIFYGYHEDGFDLKAEYILELPNIPGNVADNLELIREFVEKCFGNVDLRKQARKFAEDNLNIEVKEKERLEFIKELARS